MGKDVSLYVLGFTRYTSAQCTSRTSLEESQCNSLCSFDLLFERPIMECFENFMRCIESCRCFKDTVYAHGFWRIDTASERLFGRSRVLYLSVLRFRYVEINSTSILRPWHSLSLIIEPISYGLPRKVSI